MRAVLSNQCLALCARRNFGTTTTNNRDSESTTTSEPGPEPELKSKRKSSKKGKGEKATKRRAKKVETKKKIVIRPEDRPPKAPATPFTLWFSDWYREQPKIESLETAQGTIKKGAQIWHTVSEYEKQQYREKYESLRADYNKRREEWRAQVDPRIFREINRRRAAKGLPRIRGLKSGRPMTGFFRYFQQVREEYPQTEEDNKTYIKALAVRASGQWKAMSDTEKAKYNDPAKAEFAAWREKRRAESQVKQ